VDSSKRVGTFTSLVLDSLGNPSISYYDQKNKDLKYTGGTGYMLVIVPTVTGITPANGSVMGGTEVTITGTKFTGATAVTFDGVAATEFTVVNATSITATTPAHAVGAVDVVVTTPGGSATGTYTYEAIVVPAPTVTSIDPASGIAGTALTGVSVTGANFVVGTTPTVWLAKSGQTNITATDVMVVSATRITCNLVLSPYEATIPGQWDLGVQNEDGQYGVKSAAFAIINPPPTVTSIEPSTGQNGTTIDIIKVTGTNFGFGTNPDIWLAKEGSENITATNIQIYGTTQLSFRLNIPASAQAGTWDLYVKSKDGQSGAYLGMFTVTYLGSSLLTTDWATNGWDGWTTASSWTPTTSSDTIYGPLVEDGHGVYGTVVSEARRAGSTQSTVSRTFTAAPGEKWSTITFTGLLSSSESPAGRSLTIMVNGVDVYSATAGSDSAINGQQFTITKDFNPADVVTVIITSKQGTKLSATPYTMQYDSLTLS